MKLTGIKKSYHSTKQLSDRNDLWLYYVIRKISFYITWIFLKSGFSANQTTYIAIIVGLTGCGFMTYTDYKIKIIGTLLINFWIVLDCVDGNIARYKKESSEYGEFIDSLGGYLMNALLFLSVGIGAFNCSEFFITPVSRFHYQSYSPLREKSILSHAFSQHFSTMRGQDQERVYRSLRSPRRSADHRRSGCFSPEDVCRFR